MLTDQSGRDKYCMIITYMWTLKKLNSQKKRVGLGGWKNGEMFKGTNATRSWISSGDLMHRILIIVNNIVL